MLARMLPGSGKYIILDTDYEHYAILYSCSDLGILHAGKSNKLQFLLYQTSFPF